VLQGFGSGQREKTKFMSRTYDALKKVDKERSPYKVIGIEDAEAPSATPVTERISKIPASETASSHDGHQVSPTSDPIDLDTLLERCPPATWVPDAKAMLFFGSGERAGGAAEEFRTLRSQLYQVREKQPLRRILITSSVAKEGKSFVAANLALVIGLQPGCRVLLIDGDLRSPSLHSTLGALATPGLTEYVLGETEEFGIIQSAQIKNLFFIASGRSVSGQAEILSSSRLKFLLDRLEPIFDWIIIDSPAAVATSDSGLIANVCDGILIVVRSNSTPFDVVRKARLKLPDERLLGVVLNEIPPEV
jgi:protein-tyrosine kinase